MSEKLESYGNHKFGSSSQLNTKLVVVLQNVAIKLSIALITSQTHNSLGSKYIKVLCVCNNSKTKIKTILKLMMGMTRHGRNLWLYSRLAVEGNGELTTGKKLN